MTYKELQAALKQYKTQGLTTIKLNSKQQLLQQEYDRINKNVKPDLHYARTKVATHSSEDLQQWVNEAGQEGFTTDDFGFTIISMMKEELQMRANGESFIKIQVFPVNLVKQENNMNQISQEQAKYRVSIKRELRKLGYRDFDNEDPTEVLESKLLEAREKTKEVDTTTDANLEYNTASQEQAKYRVSVSRELRKLGYRDFDDKVPMKVLESKLLEIKKRTKGTKATEYISNLAAIYNPIRVEMQKFVNNLTMQEHMKLCRDNNVSDKDLVDFLAKRKAIPLWKQAGLA